MLTPLEICLSVLSLHFIWRKFMYKKWYKEGKNNCSREITETDEKEGPWKLIFVDSSPGNKKKEKHTTILFLKNKQGNYICVNEPIIYQPSENKTLIPVKEMEINNWYHIRQAIDTNQDHSYFHFERLHPSDVIEGTKVLTKVNSN